MRKRLWLNNISVFIRTFFSKDKKNVVYLQMMKATQNYIINEWEKEVSPYFIKKQKLKELSYDITY